MVNKNKNWYEHSNGESCDEWNRQFIWNTIHSPLGKLLVVALDEGICLLEFSDNEGSIAGRLSKAESLFGNLVHGLNGPIEQVMGELAEYFEGKRFQFDVALNPPGTDFQLNVWKNLLQIPYGTCITYTEQAKIVADEKAVRAVAAANGKNKIAILIPCHRVIGAKGRLTGYAGGIERKRWLLDFEMRTSGKFLIQPYFHNNLFNH